MTHPNIDSEAGIPAGLSIIAIDFETHLISKEEPIPYPVCLSYYYEHEGNEHKGLVVGYDDMSKLLFKLMSSKTRIIAHNMNFEALVIDTHFPKLRELLYAKFDRNELICTKICEQLKECVKKQPLYNVSLDKLVKHYFDVDISEDKKNPDSWRLRYSELEGVPLEDWPYEAVRYAIEDSKWAYFIYYKQKFNLNDAKLSTAADFYLNKMGLYGIEIQKSRVMTLQQELSDILTPLYKKLTEIGITQKTKSGKYKKSVNNLRQFVIDHVKKPEYTAKGVVATASESLNRYIALIEDKKAQEIFQDYLNIMKYEKIQTAFVSRLAQADPIIRTNYKAVVSSGRTSSSTSANFASVNMQQMPRAVENVTWDIRNCFVPRKGYKICSIDYMGLELSSTAHQLYKLTGRSNMRNIINKGDVPTDMHSMLAYRIMNIKEKKNETYESFVSKKKEKPYSEYRQLAKPINLGFPGGIGYDTMRSLLAREGITPKLVILESSQYEDALKWKRGICRKEGYPVRIRRVGVREFQLVYDELVLLKQELFGLYPDLEYFLTEGHLKYLTGEKKMVKNEFDEWEREPMYAFQVGDFHRDWCLYTQVCNGLLMQSPSAIGAKTALVNIMKRYGNSNAVRPIAFIHDEIVFEVIDSPKMPVIIQDLCEEMIDSMQTILDSVRITVEAEVFDYWAKAGGFYDKMYWKNPKDSKLFSK